MGSCAGWHLCQEEGLGYPKLIPQTGPASVNFREGDVTKNGTRNKVSVGRGRGVGEVRGGVGVGGQSWIWVNAWSWVNREKRELVGERSVIFKACGFFFWSVPKGGCSCTLC